VCVLQDRLSTKDKGVVRHMCSNTKTFQPEEAGLARCIAIRGEETKCAAKHHRL